MNKNIIYIFSLLITIVIFFIFEKNVISKISFDYNKKEFLISDITNFNWDHVKPVYNQFRFPKNCFL